jgi:hypothetical protein
MRKSSRLLSWLAAFAIVLSFNSWPSPGVAQSANNAPVPLEQLSFQQRLKTAPDSTLIRSWNKISTLGEVRAAHQARITALTNAHASALLASRDLNNQKPRVISEQSRPLISERPVAVNTKPGASSSKRPVAVNTEPLRGTELQTVDEPASDYASAPADMKAFCGAADASACLYLPPQQQIQNFNGAALDLDSLIDQSQCGNEGGAWTSFGWNSWFCQFSYPLSVKVSFTPASNYQISSTAECDQSVFTYEVDTHGAVAIQIKQTGIFKTGSSPWCVVKVKLGS